MTVSEALQIAIQHHQAGRLAHAEALYRQILAAQPNHVGALHFLGVIAHQAGRHDLAIERIRQAIKLKPDYLEAHNNLGTALFKEGEFDEAIAAYRHAIELKPDLAEVHNNLGDALRERGRLDEAIAAFRRAIELQPDYPEAHNSLGRALWERGLLDEAVASHRKALALKLDYPDAHVNLGVALAERGKLDGAVGAYRQALELKPDHLEALNNLGNALKELGQLEEAISAYRRALQIKPESASTHSNLIYALHFAPSQNERAIREEHRRWSRQFSDPLMQCLQPHANDRSPAPAGRLRVGYVSADFRDHPVGRYALPLLERHDRERFEILCYSGVTRPDWMTERLRALAGVWRSVVGISDARLAEMIREDGVDILVDLALHTGGNRLLAFARQPAPVQVAWLAYPGRAGLSSTGYRLTDAWIDPVGVESASDEEPVRLPDCWCCYQPVEDSPEINALPALSAEGVTFGSLNNFAKVNAGVLALWARVLGTAKGSRLLMFCPEGLARERVLAFFGERGIGGERVEVAGRLPRWEYLKLYHRIDIGLDPFPCNGMTTTCDALWMGVPTLTLAGDMAVSRAGLSLLSSVGLGELVTWSEEDYVGRAVEMARDLPRLADLRATLRAQMLASPLMDAPRFARNVEAAYRSMWQSWCRKQFPVPEEP